MALLEAGLAETIDEGGQIPSIEAICQRAGYTRGAFYVYFKDREHFINEMLDWVLSDIITTLFVTPTAGAVDLAEVITRFNENLARGEWPDLQNNIRAGYLAVLRELRPGSKVREQHSELMQLIADRLEELVREGQKAGTVRKGVPARDLAMLLLLSAIGSIMWDDVGIPMDSQAMGKSLLKLLSPPA